MNRYVCVSRVEQRAAIVTRIENPSSPIGFELIFNMSLDLGDRLETIEFCVPAADSERYNPMFPGIVGSVIVSELALAPRSREKDPQRASARKTLLTPQDIAKRASASTVLIVSANQNGVRPALGSGFVVAPGQVVTNSHVLGSGRMGLVHVRNSDQFLSVGSILARSVKDDLVLLDVPGLVLEPLPLSSETPQIGDRVFAMGNPEGMEGTFSEGIVSAYRSIDHKSVLQITAPISHGSSGDPVLNNYGEVIGIATGMIESGENLNFAVQAPAIAALLGMVK